MARLDDIVRRIKDQALEPGWSKSRLAIESGLHPNALRSMDDPGWDPRLETLQKLERTLDRLGSPSVAAPTEAGGGA